MPKLPITYQQLQQAANERCLIWCKALDLEAIPLDEWKAQIKSYGIDLLPGSSGSVKEPNGAPDSVYFWPDPKSEIYGKLHLNDVEKLFQTLVGVDHTGRIHKLATLNPLGLTRHYLVTTGQLRYHKYIAVPLEDWVKELETCGILLGKFEPTASSRVPCASVVWAAGIRPESWIHHTINPERLRYTLLMMHNFVGVDQNGIVHVLADIPAGSIK